MSIETKNITVSLGQLLLDPNNYRLFDGEEGDDNSALDIVNDQDDIRKKLSRKNTAELENSILENGFLEVDKIVVKKLEGITGNEKYIVIEGNRRTAAFKSLISKNYNEEEGRFEDDFPDFLINKYKSINVVLVIGSKTEIEDYSRRLMGIRHVSGPKQWSGYQSAKLINDMVLSGDKYEKISKLLGLRESEVKKRREAYLALNQMKVNERYSCHARIDLYSLFVEAVSANSAFKKEWLGWDDEKSKFENKSNLERFYSAIVPHEDGYLEIKNPSNLRDFVKAVNIKEARDQIELGVYLKKVSFDFEEHKRVQKINDFSDFLDGLKEFTSGDLIALRNLSKKLDVKLSTLKE